MSETMVAPLGGNVALDPSLGGLVRLDDNDGPGVSIMPRAIKAPDVRLIADWRPFDTIPFVYNPDAVWKVFPCLIQTRSGIVTAGHARWVPFGKAKHPRLRFYGDYGRHEPYVKYWMPLPAPKEEP